ncbi:MAG TPA: NAD(P)-binding domain-containing protein [Terracidiphilus sp.]|nr:NAD(P)-binding domain-containing protein [Terracidiphilus sp.]
MAAAGFVGLGVMGRPMLRNLLKVGHTVVAYGRTEANVDAAVADGAQRGASNADVGACAPIVVTMLLDGPEVVQQMISSLIAGGKGDFDHSAIATFVEEASHVEVEVP